MDEKTVIITEKDGAYQIQNNRISVFALLGFLECVGFDMKATGRSGSDSADFQKWHTAEDRTRLTKEPNKIKPNENETKNSKRFCIALKFLISPKSTLEQR